MVLLSLNTLVGVVIGAGAMLSPKVFAWVKKQFTSAEVDAKAAASNVASSAVATAVKDAVSKV